MEWTVVSEVNTEDGLLESDHREASVVPLFYRGGGGGLSLMIPILFVLFSAGYVVSYNYGMAK